LTAPKPADGKPPATGPEAFAETAGDPYATTKRQRDAVKFDDLIVTVRGRGGRGGSEEPLRIG
jgi:hypothetical protein